MKRLGEILIEHGSVTAEQLKQALDLQKKQKDKKVGEILIQLGFVSEEDIVIALAMQFNYAYLPLESISLDAAICQLVPYHVVQRFRFIPIDKIGNVLTITMTDPSDEAVIKEIEKITGCKIQAFVSTSTEIDKAIEKHYQKSSLENPS